MNETGALHNGTTLGDRYFIETLIGEGAFARTYRARDNRLGRTVAVKVLRPHIAADPAFLSRFRQEARAVARIDHPNVVHVYDSGDDRGASYLVMQYVPGRDLKAFIDEKAPVPPDEAIRISREILSGLAAVHAAGIIHRDIKPQNVLLGWDGIARVTDFGVAYEGNQSRQTFATELGTTLGTPAYMAPEQARGEQVTAATDLYAVGILLFELLTGQLPFTAEYQLAMMVAHVEQTPPTPSAIRPEVPPDLDSIVLRALAKLPGQRFASAADMERALELAFSNPRNSQSTRVQPIATPRGVRANAQATTVVTPNAASTPVPPSPFSPAYGNVSRKRSSGARWILPILFLAAAAAILVATLTDAFDGIGGNNGDPTKPAATRTVQGSYGGLKQVTRTPTKKPTNPPDDVIIARDPTETPKSDPTETQRPDPTETAQPEPTDTPEPTIDEQDGGVPTIGPNDGGGGESTIEPTNPGDGNQPQALSFNGTDWEGGVTRSDSDFLGRPWTAIYAESSGSNEAALRFSLDTSPDGDATLIISGVDDESGGDSPLVITVNGTRIFSDQSPFDSWDGQSSDAPWTDVSFTIPVGLLQSGSNEITVTNQSPNGDEGSPPYVLLSDATLDMS